MIETSAFCHVYLTSFYNFFLSSPSTFGKKLKLKSSSTQSVIKFSEKSVHIFFMSIQFWKLKKSAFLRRPSRTLHGWDTFDVIFDTFLHILWGGRRSGMFISHSWTYYFNFALLPSEHRFTGCSVSIVPPSYHK